MSKEIRVGSGVGVLSLTTGIGLWVIDPRTIPYKAQVWIILICFVVGLLALAYVLYALFKTVPKHTGIPFQRSTGTEVVTRESIAVDTRKVIEIKGTAATITTAFHGPRGGEFIVEQDVYREDGSTKRIDPPKES